MADLEQLATLGYTVVPGIVGPEDCRRARELLDDIFGPCGESAEEHIRAKGWELSHYLTPRAEPDDAAFWASASPFLQTENFYHDVRHPIRDSATAALINQRMIDVVGECLRSDDLKLLQQYLVRTDYRPGPYPERPGFHADHASLPAQYDATPSQHYLLAMLALSDVPSGGAATVMGRGTLQRARELATKYQEEEPEWCLGLHDEDFRNELRQRIGSEQLKDPEPMELTCSEGDLIVIDPMALHASMPMRHPGKSR